MMIEMSIGPIRTMPELFVLQGTEVTEAHPKTKSSRSIRIDRAKSQDLVSSLMPFHARKKSAR
jgi:hypothetical protein